MSPSPKCDRCGRVESSHDKASDHAFMQPGTDDVPKDAR